MIFGKGKVMMPLSLLTLFSKDLPDRVSLFFQEEPFSCEYFGRPYGGKKSTCNEVDSCFWFRGDY